MKDFNYYKAHCPFCDSILKNVSNHDMIYQDFKCINLDCKHSHEFMFYFNKIIKTSGTFTLGDRNTQFAIFIDIRTFSIGGCQFLRQTYKNDEEELFDKFMFYIDLLKNDKYYNYMKKLIILT